MRLSTSHAYLAQTLQSASPGLQKDALKVACTLALHAAPVDQPAVIAAFDQLCSGTETSAEQLSQLRALAQSLDDQYFDLQEAEEQDEASHAKSLQLFSQARSVSALSLACRGDAVETAAEALYEACAAVEDQEGFIKTVLAALPGT